MKTKYKFLRTGTELDYLVNDILEIFDLQD
jgi:hypothetical protein